MLPFKTVIWEIFRLIGGYVDDKALNGSDFPREEKEVLKGDGSKKYKSKSMFWFWVALHSIFIVLRNSWNCMEHSFMW